MPDKLKAWQELMDLCENGRKGTLYTFAFYYPRHDMWEEVDVWSESGPAAAEALAVRLMTEHYEDGWTEHKRISAGGEYGTVVTMF